MLSFIFCNTDIVSIKLFCLLRYVLAHVHCEQCLFCGFFNWTLLYIPYIKETRFYRWWFLKDVLLLVNLSLWIKNIKNKIINIKVSSNTELIESFVRRTHICSNIVEIPKAINLCSHKCVHQSLFPKTLQFLHAIGLNIVQPHNFPLGMWVHSNLISFLIVKIPGIILYTLECCNWLSFNVIITFLFSLIC